MVRKKQRKRRKAQEHFSLLCKAGLVTSRSEGRRAIEQGGVSVDGEKITDIRYNVKKEDITEEGLIVKRGKKKFMKICL